MLCSSTRDQRDREIKIVPGERGGEHREKEEALGTGLEVGDGLGLGWWHHGGM